MLKSSTTRDVRDAAASGDRSVTMLINAIMAAKDASRPSALQKRQHCEPSWPRCEGTLSRSSPEQKPLSDAATKTSPTPVWEIPPKEVDDATKARACKTTKQAKTPAIIARVGSRRNVWSAAMSKTIRQNRIAVNAYGKVFQGVAIPQQFPRAQPPPTAVMLRVKSRQCASLFQQPREGLKNHRSPGR